MLAAESERYYKMLEKKKDARREKMYINNKI